MIRRKEYKAFGFTLLELSVVLLILSVMLSGTLSIVQQEARRSKQADLKTKMDAIETALLNFRRANNRLPCPADGSVAMTTQYFGVEGAAAGTCTNGSTYSNGSDLTGDGGTPVAPDANFYDGVNTVGGVIPVRTLGLPDEYMFDPWGGAFTYIADKRMTATYAFFAYPITTTSVGSITVQDGSGNNRIPTTAYPNDYAIALVMSHGPNGHGAFQLGGKRRSYGSTNVNELINCHCTSASPPANNTFGALFIQSAATTTSSTDPLQTFDDVVRYYARSNLLSCTDSGMGGNCQKVPLFDTFTGPNGSLTTHTMNIGPGWSMYPNSYPTYGFKIQSNALQAILSDSGGNPGASANYAWADSGQHNVTISVVANANDPAPGTNYSYLYLVGRYSDANNLVSLDIIPVQCCSGPQGLALYQVVGGVVTVLASQAFTVNATANYTMTLSFNGSSVTGTAVGNGQSISVSGTVSGALAGTKAGILSNKNLETYTNFLVTSP